MATPSFSPILQIIIIPIQSLASRFGFDLLYCDFYPARHHQQGGFGSYTI